MNPIPNPSYLSVILASAIAVVSSATALASDSYNFELASISHNESRNGKNIAHKILRTGMHKGMRAGGWFGLMPLTVKNILSRSAKLRAKYGYLMTMRPSDVSERLDRNRVMDREIALYHWTELRKKFSPVKAAYAWFHGSGKADRVSEGEAFRDEYVRNFYNYWKSSLKRTHEPAQGS